MYQVKQFSHTELCSFKFHDIFVLIFYLILYFCRLWYLQIFKIQRFLQNEMYWLQL